MTTGNGKILIMDDEQMMREVTGEMPKHFGYEVEFAKDGVEALEKYASAMTSGTSFDAVSIDLTIHGGMGGEEAVKKLIELAPDVRRLFRAGTQAIRLSLVSGDTALPVSLRNLIGSLN